MTTEQETKSCEGCGATIYPEHVEAGRAAYWAGQLLCPVCLNEKQSDPEAVEVGPESEAAPEGEVIEVGSEGDSEVEEQPLTLVDEDEVEKAGRTISAFGGSGGVAAGIFDEEKLARQVKADSVGASRMRVFHTKMSDGAAAFMAQTINEWLDAHPEVVVKFVQSTVGIWEGKHAEPHLILTVWY